MAVWLNVGSLVLGLIAWILPVVNIVRFKKPNKRNWIVLSMMSISACAASLVLQMFYNHHLVRIEDWGGLMDITGSAVFIGAFLFVVTILLNALTLIIYRSRTAK